MGQIRTLEALEDGPAWTPSYIELAFNTISSLQFGNSNHLLTSESLVKAQSWLKWDDFGSKSWKKCIQN